MKCAKSALLAVTAGASLGIAGTCPAQISGGGYEATGGTTALSDISGVGTEILSNFFTGNSLEVLFPVDFDFDFYGPQSSVFVHVEGLLSFGAAVPANPFPGFVVDFETTSISPDVPAIAVLWDIWRTDTPGHFVTPADAVYHYFDAAASPRTFTIQWNEVAHFFADLDGNDGKSSATFQVVLFEGTNQIEMRYLDTEVEGTSGPIVPLDEGASAGVGIRNIGGDTNDDALQWKSAGGLPLIPSGTSVLFTPSAPPPPPPTPEELIADLVGYTFVTNVNNGVSNSLDAKLDSALDALTDANENNNGAAVNKLEAFINHVEAQRGNQINEVDADYLIAAAEEIIALLLGS